MQNTGDNIMSLRMKILSGFLILALMLFVAGAWSIYELRTLGISSEKLLYDNYQSIHAGRLMIEALEREDSAILLLLLGRWKEGRDIIESADIAFQNGFNMAKNNITIEDEESHINKIGTAYQEYKSVWERPIVDTKKQGDLNWYFSDVHNAFQNVKNSVEKLIQLNDQTMYDTAYTLKNRAYHTIMPGIIASLSALGFVLIFNFFINLYIVSPIINITKGIQGFLKTKDIPDYKIESKDEISYLASSVRELLVQIKHSEEKK
jgi:HAMP domain-containing protein